MLDVNVGAASVDEVALLPQAVRLVQDTVDLPVCIDSANPAALLGEIDRGAIEPGRLAHLVELTDDLRVRRVTRGDDWIDGAG